MASKFRLDGNWKQPVGGRLVASAAERARSDEEDIELLELPLEAAAEDAHLVRG